MFLFALVVPGDQTGSSDLLLQGTGGRRRKECERERERERGRKGGREGKEMVFGLVT